MSCKIMMSHLVATELQLEYSTWLPFLATQPTFGSQ